MSAFETAVAGALWSNERVNEAYPDVPPICARCNDAVETDFHTIWLCPCNDLIDRESDHFKGRAMSEVDNEPCLWLRGILPSRLAIISKDDIAQRSIFYFQGTPPPLGSWPSGVHYGDGRGKYGKIPEARRCGSAVAYSRRPLHKQ